MSWFPYEDSASTTPINFPVVQENHNWPGGVLSLFFRAKLSCIFLTFILTNSIKAVKLRKSVRSASYLTTQPRPFSPLQWSNLGIFQPSPVIPRFFFPQLSPPTQCLSTRWAILLASFSQPPTQYLLIRWEFLSIVQPSPTQCLDHEWVYPRCFTRVPPSIFPTRRGQVTCSTAK